MDTIKIKLLDKEVTLRFVLGAVQDWQALGDDKYRESPEGQRMLYALLEVYGGEGWLEDGFDTVAEAKKLANRYKALSISELKRVNDALAPLLGNEGAVAK